jgi:hypothetical protein
VTNKREGLFILDDLQDCYCLFLPRLVLLVRGQHVQQIRREEQAAVVGVFGFERGFGADYIAVLLDVVLLDVVLLDVVLLDFVEAPHVSQSPGLVGV